MVPISHIWGTLYKISQNQSQVFLKCRSQAWEALSDWIFCSPWDWLLWACCLTFCPVVVCSRLMQIIHTDSNTVLGQNDTGFSCDGSANTFRVMFKEPVEILPNVNYTACATLKVCVAFSAPHTHAAQAVLRVYSCATKINSCRR